VKDRIGDVVAHLSGWASAHARLVIALSWMVAVASGLLAARLDVFGDFSNLLPPDTESVRHLRALEKRTRVLADYMVGVESDDPKTRAAAGAMLRERLDAIDHDLVSGITSDQHAPRQFAWDHRFLFASLSDLTRARDALERKLALANPMYVALDDDAPPTPAPGGVELPPQPIDDLEAKLDKAKADAADQAPLISKDGHLQLFIVRTTFTSDDSVRGPRLNALIFAAAHDVEARFPGTTVGIAGDVITSLIEHDSLLKGMVASTLVTIVLVVGALLLYYRSVLGVGALFWSLSVGVVATFAFTRLSIGHLNLASAFLSSIVIGNGINCGMVLLSRYQEELLLHPDPAVALPAAVRGAAPGTLVATLTAAVAYGSLTVTPFRGFRDFGIIGAVGMLLCWISAFTVFPAGLTLLGRRVRGGSAAELGKLLDRLLPARPRLVAGLGLGLLAITGAMTVRYLTHDPLEDDLRNLRSYNAELDAESAWMHKFDEAFGGGISGGFVIGVDDESKAAAVAARLKAYDAGKERHQHMFSQISTLDDVLPSQQPEKLAVLADIRRMLDHGILKHASPDERPKLTELRPPDDLRALGFADIPDSIAWPYVEKDGTRGRFVLANTGWGVDGWKVSALKHFADVVRGMKLGPDVIVGGSAFVFSDMLAAMTQDGPRATAAAMLGSVLVVLLVLGVGREARVTLACAGLGIMAMLSAAYAMGIKVNFLDFVALPITIGIGVDYGVNIVARARQSGGARAGRAALVSTGPVVSLCSYTTVVGYASLLFSQNRGIHTFGLSAMIGELTCLSAALLLAPALLDFGAASAPAEPAKAT
jgi:predicted RND superfamily exporter protein